MWTLLAAFLLAISPIQGQSVVTNGTSGQPCPHRKCLAGRADCINGTCRCRPPYELDPDNGNFACYRQNDVFGEVKNDPVIVNFNNEAANFPFPCRYLVTSTQTVLTIEKRRAGYCQCLLHSWNNKYRGKFYAGGFDFTCRINNTARNEKLEFTISIAGKAENGVYTYSELGLGEFLPVGPWTGPPVNATGAGITVKSSYDFVNNQARVSIPECGWSITFVAYDIKERLHQSQIPGLAFSITCKNPVFYDHDIVMATAPVRFGGTRYRDLVIPPLTLTDTLLFRGFDFASSHNQPGALYECSAISSITTRCRHEGDKTRAALKCFWLFKYPRFIRCIDPQDRVDRLFLLAAECIYHFCVGAISCGEFVDDIVSTGCGYVSGIPELASIVGGRFCD